MNTIISQNLILIILATTTLLSTILAYLFGKSNSKRKIEVDRSKSTMYISTIILTVLAVSFSLFVKMKEERLKDSFSEIKQKQLNDELSILKTKIHSLASARDSVFNLIIKNDTLNLGQVDSSEHQRILDSRISKIENEFQKQVEITTSLRQAINPIKPEEILTIARLKDEIVELNKNVSTLNDNLKIRQDNFEDSIKREISTSNNSTTLILVVLIPLVLNFLYTVWKDFKKPDKKEDL